MGDDRDQVGRDRAPDAGVILFGVTAARASWARFYLEPVQPGGGSIDSAVAAQLRGAR